MRNSVPDKRAILKALLSGTLFYLFKHLLGSHGAFTYQFFFRAAINLLFLPFKGPPDELKDHMSKYVYFFNLFIQPVKN
jgi:hypothetical protein